MNDVDKRMKAIKEKYHISREELNNLGMDEFDYETSKERAKKNYIKGLLFEIVKKNCSIDRVTDNIIEMCKVENLKEYQKIILGELSDCIAEGKHKSQVVSVSCQIATFLKSETGD